MLIIHMGGDRTRWVAGCMTGTSLDGLDVVLARVKGSGLQIKAECMGAVHEPLGELADVLQPLATGQPAAAIDYLRGARQLGRLHAEVIDRLCSGRQLDLVVAHGQTIRHAPDEQLSFQLLDPWPIVRRLNVPVCYDLRQADLIAGGQGAPITPLADWVLYRRADRHRRIVNLGGICNVTDLPAHCLPADVTGQDIGPCNLLIDAVVRRFFPDERFDRDGAISSQGRAGDGLYELMLQSAFFARARPRTTGREDFDRQWVNDLLERCDVTGADAVASAVYAVGRLVLVAAPPNDGDLVLAGGGSKNPTLVETIRAHAPDSCHVVLSDHLGIACEAREALCLAVLGALSQDGVPVTLGQVTGAKEPGVAGAWIYP